MSQLKSPPPGLLFASFLFRRDLLDEADLKACWQMQYGESTFFSHSFCPMKRYYAEEMGDEAQLERFFAVCQNPRDRSELKAAKFWAISQEEKHLEQGQRRVNLDVGMVTLENLQLATGKNFTHRVYLGDGVFSDLTLIFQKHSFQALPWTYPDYSHPEIIDFFNRCRKPLRN